jgi:diguanylate cyclase (GGDEF)-like protein
MALLTTTLVRRLAGEYDAAQASLDRAGRLAARYLLSGPAIAVLGEQAELHAARGEYQLAFETHRDFHRADVELRALERDSRARSMNAIFEATEARRSSDYFRELSGRDPLTGLHNRRHLDDRLDDWLRQPGDAASVAPVDGGAPHVTPTQLTVALLDLDHFKRVNDTVSHAVGDEVLRHVATLLRTAVDDVEGGFAVRMGGEEFLLLLPGVTRAEAVARLERVRADIAGYRWRDLTQGHDLHEPLVVTASVGIAVAPDDQTERGPLLAHADANLYRAKHAGRNRVVH